MSEDLGRELIHDIARALAAALDTTKSNLAPPRSLPSLEEARP